MGFFDDKLGPLTPSQPVTPQTVAPGSWWQTPAQQQQVQPQQQLPASITQPVDFDDTTGTEYRPRNSAFVKSRLNNDVDDTCPRCGSYEYVKIAAEAAQGSTYRLPGASVRCLVCNYPAIDTSEGVVGSLAGTATAVSVGETSISTLKVKERGGRNQNSFAGFNESSQAEGSTVMRIM